MGNKRLIGEKNGGKRTGKQIGETMRRGGNG